MSSTLAKIRQERLDKVRKLRDIGINPYPSQSSRTHKNHELVTDYSKLEGQEVTVVGRVMAWREHGQLRFAEIQDASGSIQLIIRKDQISSLDSEKQILGWKELRLIDVGDFVQSSGVLTKSKRGEISVDVRQFKLLTKSIRPLPDKWEGIKDKEIRFRRRYLDLATDSTKRDFFRRKSDFWAANRRFMDERGFIEVETPVLEHVTGGADASPFTTHHNALDTDFYLRISTELYLKRLVGGGFEKVYTLGPNFRNEGIDDEHLQEYHQIEWYWAYADYRDNMQLVAEMFRYIAEEVYGKTQFTRGDHKFDLADEWKEIDYVKIINEKHGIDIFADTEDAMKSALDKYGVVLGQGSVNRLRLIDNLWKIIRKEIPGPAFLINEPKFMSPLAKSRPDKEDLTERFHIILAGSELGNGYSELNDPVDQYERFLEQQHARDQGDDEAQMMDIDYVEMLEYGMPPTSGYAHSERLFWFLEDVSAREGTLFPQNKFHLDETTKEIYGISEQQHAKAMTRGTFLSTVASVRRSISASQVNEFDDPNVISIDTSLHTKYENINIGVAVIRGIDVKKKNEELEKLKAELYTKFQKALKSDEIDDIPEIASFHQMYEKMGVDLRSRKPSPEAMLRRIVEGKELYTVNTCVDAYNIAVQLNQISAGAFDMAGLEFPVVVREAKDGEEIEIIGGEVKKLKDGEVCYFDKYGAYNMDYNYRDAERTKVTENTKDVFINVEGVGMISRNQVADQLQLVIDLITRFCGGTVEMKGMLKSKMVI